MDSEISHIREVEWLLREKYNGVATKEFERDCERLASGEPLGYVIGFVPFLGAKIWLGSKPLIPRPETEYWVEKVIKNIQDDGHRKSVISPTPLHVLDLCAGSGCIGLAVAKHARDARVDFAEIDPHHHLTILKSLAENRIPLERTRIIGGDLFEKITDRYDYILTNPPYIDPALRERMGEGVLEHEPHLALFGGAGGMEIIARIIAESPQHLTADGTLIIEHEPEQVEAIHTLAKNHGFQSCTTLLDQYRVARTTVLSMKPLSMAQ